MIKQSTSRLLPLLLILASCAAPPVDEGWMPPEPSRVVDDVLRVAGNWEPHLPAGEAGLSWGNHRAVIHIDDATSGETSVRANIPWRRIDAQPGNKAIVVVDSASGEAIPNARALFVEAERGAIAFEPNDGSTTYYVYYMPWESTGGYYPRVTYPSTVLTPSAEWATMPAPESAKGRTIRIESVDDFHSFFPMEIPATRDETRDFVGDADWMVVPEYGRQPVRMRHAIPQHWTTRGDEPFTTVALHEESHALQLAVFAARTELRDVQVEFSGFPDELIEAMSCLNCGGTQYTGEVFDLEVDVAQGDVQPLWILFEVPSDMPVGRFEGTATVSSSNAGSKTITFGIRIHPDTIVNHGYDDPASQSRLAWLNSTKGRDNDFIIAPYEPVTFEGNSLSILGRTIDLEPTGLPAGITSFFTEEMTGLQENGEPILAEPIELEILRQGTREVFDSEPITIRSEGRGRAAWSSTSVSEHFRMEVDGALEYDGMLDYTIALTATQDVAVDDIALPIAYDFGASRWMLGLGQKGRERPRGLDWKWKVENHQEGLWMGAVNKGLQYVLRDENYERPLNTNFYQNQPLNMPRSWDNDGQGGIRLRETGDMVVVDNYSGPREIRAGETVYFNIRFLITPFRALDTETHFNTRFVHKYVPVDSVKAWGGTVVNIHHANEINPYINYPFYNLEGAKAYIDEAHAKGIKVKLYDTIRELTYKAHELFAMRSLGEEIFNSGEGGGHSWLQEHLQDDYHSAWHAWRVDDAAILNKGTSRWTNYYIEGLSWLAANQEMDGLYLDDIAFSRETVKRMISVLHAERDEVVIDLHSANQFNPNDGYINSAMLYMEHFPFISRLWFGEYFEYDLDPDYWMAEVSGLPFGLMGEMLQDGGRPYRGMLYGMTTRLYGDVDPRPVWKLMNDFGIAQSRMLGWWLIDAPVRTGRDDVQATAFVREDGSMMIALASWAAEDVDVTLSFRDDLTPLAVAGSWTIPAVEGLQKTATAQAGGALTLPVGKGLFLLVSAK